MKLAGAVDGDPFDPQTASGTPKYLLDALAQRHEVTRVNYQLGAWQRRAVLAATVRWPRDEWRRSYHVNRLAFNLRSRTLRRGLEKAHHDLAIQVLGWINPAAYPGPYVVYTDTTFETVRRHWPPWVPKGRAAFQLERAMFQGARHVFMSNKQAAESLATYGVPVERVSVIGGGRNFDVRPPFARSREPTILFVGREFERKGGDVLLTAFRVVRDRLPSAKLVIAGPTFSIQEPGVEIRGNITDRAELAQLYVDAGVFCLPSRYDPLPNAIAEAMAHGLPCVGSRTGGIPEIMHDGKHGLLVDPGDVAGLAASLVTLLENPGFADKLGAAGRHRVEHEWNWTEVAKRMEPGLIGAT